MDLRQRITDESSRLFLKHGLRSTSMDFISTELGISKRTLYENFKDKEELISQCVSFILEQKHRHKRSLQEKSTNCIELFLACYEHTIKEMGSFNSNFVRELKRYYPSIYLVLDKESKGDMEDQILILKKGQDEGFIRKDVNVRITSLLLHAQFEMLWISDLFNFKSYTFSEVLSTIIINTVRGIATQKGLDIVDNYSKGNNTSYQPVTNRQK